MSARHWKWTALVGVMGLWACGGNGIPDPQPVQSRVKLVSFSGASACQELEQYVEDTAVLQMRTQLEQTKNGGGGVWLAEDARGAPPQAGAAEANTAPSGPSAYTTTNTQVAGVDEADFVKNDGQRIFVLSGETLYINRSWPPSALQLVSTLKIEGWPQQMFLDEQNHVVVFSTIYTPYAFDTAMGMPCSPMYCGYSYGNTLKVTVVDVSDLAQPKVQQQFYLPGHYNNARRIGSSVRLVVSDSFRYPPDVRWYPEYSEGLYEDKARLAKAIDELIVENERLIRARSLAEWLPSGKVVAQDGTVTELPLDCTSFAKTTAPTRLGLLTIATLNLQQPTQVQRTTVIAESGEVYASAKSLYVANTHWWWWPAPGQTDATYLHKFDLTDPNQAVYVASGVVDGHIIDQFSMDEDARGYFRVATTIGTRVADPNNSWGRIELVNRVSVLAEDSGELKVVGKTPDLAKDERIYSSRFIEDRGFLVTFRQVDPLFTLDLSDPTAPKVVGELKVPGFSTYLHPIDRDHLLAIGTYVPEDNTDWRARALQLAIFDVSDFANPKQAFVHTVGTAYSWSEASYDHKAFNYFPEKKLLAIPFFDWSPTATDRDSYWTSFVSELRVFSIDAQAGITPKGALSMTDVYRVSDDYGWTYYWTPMVRRSVMADDFVYAISDAGIRVAQVSSLASPIATVQFSKSGN